MPDDASASGFVLWGATGQAKILAEIIRLGGGRVLQYFDADAARTSPEAGVPIGHGEASLRTFTASLDRPEAIGALAAIGGERGADRLRYLALFRELGFAVPVLVHPNAWVSPSAELGANCQILAQAAVGVEARLGEACIVNTSAGIDHECVLGDGVHIGPGARLAGCVSVGERAFVGTGAVVLPWISIGADAVIGAGSVVTRDVPAGTMVAGNPARPFARDGQGRKSITVRSEESQR